MPIAIEGRLGRKDIDCDQPNGKMTGIPGRQTVHILQLRKGL